jgi:hypothetical protein
MVEVNTLQLIEKSNKFWDIKMIYDVDKKKAPAIRFDSSLDNYDDAILFRKNWLRQIKK